MNVWGKIEDREEEEVETEKQQGDVLRKGSGEEKKTERCLADLQHNHPMCLRLAWQRHH